MRKDMYRQLRELEAEERVYEEQQKAET